MNKWTNGEMDKWANGQMDKLTNAQMDKWTNEQMNQWTNERMNKWTNEQMDKWTNGQMNKWTNERMNQWTNEQMSKWTKEQMNEWTNEQMNKWANEQMNKWTNGQRTTKVQHNKQRYNITTITIITILCREGVRKGRFQQQDDNTLRDRRKGDPKHECCGKNACKQNVHETHTRWCFYIINFLCTGSFPQEHQSTELNISRPRSYDSKNVRI